MNARARRVRGSVLLFLPLAEGARVVRVGAQRQRVVVAAADGADQVSADLPERLRLVSTGRMIAMRAGMVRGTVPSRPCAWTRSRRGHDARTPGPPGVDRARAQSYAPVGVAGAWRRPHGVPCGTPVVSGRGEGSQAAAPWGRCVGPEPWGRARCAPRDRPGARSRSLQRPTCRRGCTAPLRETRPACRAESPAPRPSLRQGPPSRRS